MLSFSLDKEYDTYVVMYAFGVCLLEMLTNEEPRKERYENITSILICKKKDIIPLALTKITDNRLRNVKIFINILVLNFDSF